MFNNRGVGGLTLGRGDCCMRNRRTFEEVTCFLENPTLVQGLGPVAVMNIGL